MRLRAIVVLVAILLASGQALAQPPTQDCPDEQPAAPGEARPRIPDDCHRGQSIVGTNPSIEGGDTHAVDCSVATIASVMPRAQPGDTIMIDGTCNEAVLVGKDDITLDGGESAVIDGGGADTAAIAVIGRRNVTIRGLTVQNGRHGIRLAAGAAAVLEGSIVAAGNTRHGVLVEQNSHASVQGTLEANSNGSHGASVDLGSSIRVHSVGNIWATIQANDNGDDGINVNNGSSARFGGGANVEATNNGVTGLSVVNGSSALFGAEAEAGGGFIGTFTDNGGDGIQAWVRSSLTAWDDGVVGDITVANNRRFGILVDEGSAAFFGTPDSGTTSKLILSGNSFDGAGVGNNSSFTVRTPAEIRGNTSDGIATWAGSSVDLGTVLGTPTTITGNGEYDLAAWSGATVYLHNATVTNVGAGWSHLGDGGGNRIGTVNCVGVVWSYGDLSCPVPEPEPEPAPEQ